MTVVYESQTVMVEETSVGCFITGKDRGTTVQVGELADINAIIDSLERLKSEWYGEEK